MIPLIAKWFINALALYIVAYIIPGIHLTGFTSALIASVVIGFLNAIVKPVLFFLTLPVTIITLGLFVFIINAFLLLLAGSISPGFTVDGLGAALLGSILLTVVTMILHGLVK